ncbi:MAG: hypothetical protein R2856_02365 [Caldilineaceae bacterium]
MDKRTIDSAVNRWRAHVILGNGLRRVAERSRPHVRVSLFVGVRVIVVVYFVMAI